MDNLFEQDWVIWSLIVITIVVVVYVLFYWNRARRKKYITKLKERLNKEVDENILAKPIVNLLIQRIKEKKILYLSDIEKQEFKKINLNIAVEDREDEYEWDLYVDVIAVEVEELYQYRKYNLYISEFHDFYKKIYDALKDNRIQKNQNEIRESEMLIKRIGTVLK